MLTQTIILREVLGLYGGQELIIGAVLGIWLVTTGIGSLSARWIYTPRPEACNINLRRVIVLQTISVVLPIMQLVGLRYLRSQYLVGQAVGLLESFLGSLLGTAPYCIISGSLLVGYALISKEAMAQKKAGSVYLYDTLGGALAGIAFTAMAARVADHAQILLAVLPLSILPALLLRYHGIFRWWHLVLPLVPLQLILATVGSDIERVSIAWLYPKAVFANRVSSPYGVISLTKDGEEVNYYMNGGLVASDSDVIGREELVHYGLSQHINPEKVLVVSGGLNGALSEVLKYSPKSIDYIELDQSLLSFVKGTMADERESDRINFIIDDGRKVISASSNRYDAILLGVPDPDSAQANRYFTYEFFVAAKKALCAGGVLTFSLRGFENYASQDVTAFSSSIYRALKEVFLNVIVIPGARQYFVASDSALSYEIIEALKKRRISTQYVRPGYISAQLTEERLSSEKLALSMEIEKNSDLRPIAWLSQTKYWLSEHGLTLVAPLAFLFSLIFYFIWIVSSSPSSALAMMVGSSGFAGMALEILILMGFQLVAGSMYLEIGLIVSAFMLGGVIGTIVGSRIQSNKFRSFLLISDLLLILLSVAVTGIFSDLSAIGASPNISLLIALGLNVLIGSAVCIQIPASVGRSTEKHEEQKFISSVFGVEYLGAAIGAFGITGVIIPSYGFFAAGFVVSILKTISFLFVWKSFKGGNG